MGNVIEYEYMAEKVKKKEILNVVICYETRKEDHSRTAIEKEEKHTRYAWLSSRQINHKNNLTLACEGSVLDKNRIKEAREKKFMWKLELVA
ncbi:MAG TPA: hypothetical protein GXX35_00585 [Thermoanaerobacterales bacterium]|nr:hypothetical protein [Thermoanaerobacterales bacterium]